ncbi:TPA: hypothetical protein I8273_004382 [Aeromonas hydrophila]|nr:hypothetical protein [Aeromonas hydrophila]HAT2638848.1 hypothetical protein [Aeromonas hydrophila]HAT3424065.1 hypothetical protein [Aeromonas hydrophila]HAT3534127.1 hypothetical protein [Aeromonas hydrophila]
MNELTADNATHYLRCRHVLGHGVTNYRMRCHVIKTMPDGRLKVQVYGERYWNDERRKKSKIRYVEAARVTEIEQKSRSGDGQRAHEK